MDFVFASHDGNCLVIIQQIDGDLKSFMEKIHKTILYMFLNVDIQKIE